MIIDLNKLFRLSILLYTILYFFAAGTKGVTASNNNFDEMKYNNLGSFVNSCEVNHPDCQRLVFAVASSINGTLQYLRPVKEKNAHIDVKRLYERTCQSSFTQQKVERYAGRVFDYVSNVLANCTRCISAPASEFIVMAILSGRVLCER